jgi:ABC-type glutathione transport system ATPase component
VQDPLGSFDPQYSVEQLLEQPLRLHFRLSARQRQQRIEELLSGRTEPRFAAAPSSLFPAASGNAYLSPRHWQASPTCWYATNRYQPWT